MRLKRAQIEKEKIDAKATLEEVERQIRDVAKVRARASINRVYKHLKRSPYQTLQVKSPNIYISLFLYNF